MKILIISFKAGEGHNSAAKAILERVEHEGHEGEIVDFLGLFSDKISNAVNVSYVGIVKHVPALFGTFYKLSSGISRCSPSWLHSPLYLDSAIISKRLRTYLEKNGPYDGIVATHLMPAQALAHMKKHGYNLPVTIAVATDYTYYPFWQEVAACDYYVIPNEGLIPTYVKRGMPREKLCPYGIPIRMSFVDLPTREESRAHLGFDADTPLYLVMGGSMGAGSMQKFAKKFHEKMPKNEHMIIICGKNEVLRASLEKHFAGVDNVHIVGFTLDIPKYMMACDVLYTKPGGLSSSEALSCRIPTVHTAPIPGCESDNFRFFTKKGCSLGAKSINKQIECGLRLMASPELRTEMRVAQAKCAKPYSSLDIFKLIEKHRSQKENGGES
ncbi:MAG: glycosyl transferase [Clostridia bacterium]|nr:glycosyl transferase [Clostridia bacterium]